MGLTQQKDGWYVEFRVLDDGTELTLGQQGTGRWKRWKVGSFNKGEARKQEAIIKTRLMAGQEASPSVARIKAITFRQWAKRYLQLEEVKALRSFTTRRICVEHLIEYFGDKLLSAIRPEDVRRYREQRVQYPPVQCKQCDNKAVRRRRCECGWERQDRGRPVSLQTVNHDHAALITMLNLAR